MKRSLCVLTAASVAGSAGLASANIRITEYMYSGNAGEFVEFTNLGDVAIDMTGWSYDDDSREPGVLDLSAFGVVGAGESVIITEDLAESFRLQWGLSASVRIIGEYTNNLGRNDEINLFDADGNLVDRLTYGDGAFPGSVRTQTISGNVLPGAAGQNDPFGWVLSADGDAFGSYFSTAGDLGNPGIYIPAPGAAALLGLAGLAGVRRRR